MKPTSGQAGAVVEWMVLTIDCPDPNVMADFYATALGGEVTAQGETGAYVRAAGLDFVFRADPHYRPPTWPSTEVPLQSHFEFVVADLEAAAERMVQLGATYAAHQDPDDPHLIVLLDPAGHPFCLIRSSAATRR